MPRKFREQFTSNNSSGNGGFDPNKITLAEYNRAQQIVNSFNNLNKKSTEKSTQENFKNSQTTTTHQNKTNIYDLYKKTLENIQE